MKRGAAYVGVGDAGAEVAREERLREGRGEGDAEDLACGAEEVRYWVKVSECNRQGKERTAGRERDVVARHARDEREQRRGQGRREAEALEVYEQRSRRHLTDTPRA